MSNLFRKYNFLVVSALTVFLGCASNTVKNAERNPAEESSPGQIAFIFDESSSEPRVMAIQSTVKAEMNVFTCLKGKIISDVLQGGADPVAYVNDAKNCKQEIKIQNETEMTAFMDKVEDYLATSKSERRKNSLIGGTVVFGAFTSMFLGNAGFHVAVDKWASRVSEKYLSSTPTSFYRSSIDWFSTLFAFGQGTNRNYTYFKSNEAQTAYDRVFRNAKVIKKLGFVTIISGSIAMMSYGLKTTSNQTEIKKEERNVRAVGVTLKDLFERGPSQEKIKDVGLSSLFNGLREAGYPDWGKI